MNVTHIAKMKRVFHAVYVHPDGTHWEDTFENISPDVGLTGILSIVYGDTSKATDYFIGLVAGPGASNTYAPADTMASHSGWAETQPYSDTYRQTAAFPASATAKSISNSSSPAVFNINATQNVAGLFLVDEHTKGGGTGMLMGVGNFSTGDKSVSAGGTLTVTVTCQAA